MNVRLPSRLYSLYQAAWRPLFAPITSGTNVFTREWDLLIILDGCRVDALRAVSDEFSFIDTVDSMRSVGSQSKEWLAKTFTPENRDEIEHTAYVTANVFTDEVFGDSENDRRTNPANWTTVAPESFEAFVELWHDEWDEELDIVPPRPVTDAAISIGRQIEPDRLVVHYMQPHEPFIAGEEPVRNVWDSMRQGELDRDTVWEHYLNNLRLVLRDVELLLANVDAPRVVLTSDHGNAFGEWGIYGHPIGFQHPSVKNVPWAETTASDLGEYEPDWTPPESRTDPEGVDERLRALGYR